MQTSNQSHRLLRSNSNLLLDQMTLSQCAACHEPIEDQWVYEVLGCFWHAHCLRCADCEQSLTEKCFSRDGKFYCHRDFFRRDCAGCSQEISQGEYYLSAWDQYYHWSCYKCCLCLRQVHPGEEVHWTNGNRFLCKDDFLARMNCTKAYANSTSKRSSVSQDFDKENASFKSHPPASNSNVSSSDCSKDDDTPDLLISSSILPDDKDRSCSSASFDQQLNKADASPKKRGPRTTIKTKQLEQLRTAFASTPKPTRHIREELARTTGLAMRVIQVWFQNRRSKERRIKQSMNPNNTRRHYYSRGTSDHPTFNYPSDEFSPSTMYPGASIPSYNDFMVEQELQQRLQYRPTSNDEFSFAMRSAFNTPTVTQSSVMDFDDVHGHFSADARLTSQINAAHRNTFAPHSWN